MSFSVNTNITSLQAQETLRQTSDFQAKTIGRVTSGLRIVSSGDDAAGLAIANGFRSDQAVLSQGVRNANDGLSTLQTIDGGMSNISKLLDRARTLATQSASGTFTGDRSVLNNEFQNVVTEISRQAQAVGLDTGGQFAKSLSVFIGGGKTNNSVTSTANGSIGLDLSKSTVDSRSLGLQGVEATAIAGTNLAASSATSVSNILADATNKLSQATQGYTDFYFRGSGFSDASAVKVSVNLSGVTDTSTLAAAVNTAITNAGNGTTSAATAFKNAGITAVVHTDADGKQSLAFDSSNTAFQVQAGDQTANALMGNLDNQATASGSVVSSAVIDTTGAKKSIGIAFDGGSAVTYTLGTTYQKTNATVADVVAGLNANASFAAAGKAYLDSNNHVIIQSNKTGSTSEVNITDAAADLSRALGLTSGANLDVTLPATNTAATGRVVAGKVTGQASAANTGTTATGSGIIVRFQGSGLAAPVDIKLAVSTGVTTVDTLVTNLSSAVANNAQLQAAGIKVGGSFAVGGALTFTNNKNETFSVEAAGDRSNVLGLGSWALANDSTATSMDYTSIGSTSIAAASTLEFSVGGGEKFALSAVTLTGAAGDADLVNAQLAKNTTAMAAGLVASGFGATFQIASTNGTAFRVQDINAAHGSGLAAAAGVASAGSSVSTSTPEASTYNSGGADTTKVLAFTAIQNGGDSQTLAISSNDATGQQHSTSLVLSNNLTARNGGSIDAAVNAINKQLQQTNDTTLQGIVAVKENSNGLEQIRFMSTNNFEVSVGSTTSGNGVGTNAYKTGSQGTNVDSTTSAGGGSADISNQASAQAAVNALSTAVSTLGKAQAVVGKGQNQLNYAVNLAQSQLSNLAAAESRIRDADLASEAANLTKAQILMQAGVAALAQANSAPQQILSLLKG